MNHSLGTICNLKNSELKILIIGYNGKSIKQPNYVFNYVGCIYPAGFYDVNNLVYFNNEHIDSIVFNGYSMQNANIVQQSNSVDGSNVTVNEESKYTFDENGVLIAYEPTTQQEQSNNIETLVPETTPLQIIDVPN